MNPKEAIFQAKILNLMSARLQESHIVQHGVLVSVTIFSRLEKNN